MNASLPPPIPKATPPIIAWFLLSTTAKAPTLSSAQRDASESILPLKKLVSEFSKNLVLCRELLQFISILLYSTRNSSQYHVAVWMGGEVGGEWIHACLWLSLFDVHTKLSNINWIYYNIKWKVLKIFFLSGWWLVGLVTKSCLTFATPWTVARQGPLSMGLPRQEYWSRLPIPSAGDHPDPGIKPGSPALQADSLPTELWSMGIIAML